MAKQPKDPSLYPTKNDLPADARSEMVEALNARLADAIDLMLQAKQAHWNVRGANFRGLHELFDEVSEAASGWADLMAERAVQLGGTASGTVRSAASRSTLGEYPLGARSGEEHVSAMTAALAHFCRKARASIEEATDALDAGTADLFTGVSREADKLLWMVEAHAG